MLVHSTLSTGDRQGRGGASLERAAWEEKGNRSSRQGRKSAGTCPAVPIILFRNAKMLRKFAPWNIYTFGNNVSWVSPNMGAFQCFRLPFGPTWKIMGTGSESSRRLAAPHEIRPLVRPVAGRHLGVLAALPALLFSPPAVWLTTLRLADRAFLTGGHNRPLSTFRQGPPQSDRTCTLASGRCVDSAGRPTPYLILS